VDRRGCFVPCEDNRLYAFDGLTGAELWEPFICQGPLRDPIQVGANTIFQYAHGDQFYAINLVNGKERWHKADPRLVMAATGGNVYLLDKSRNLLIVNEILGTVKASLPMTGMDVFARNTDASAMYTATRDGRVFCIRLLSAGHMTPDDLKERKP